MKKVLFSLLAVVTFVGCSNKGSGELVGVKGDAWQDPTPYGMVYIKSGSFTMGSNDQDANWALATQSKVVSIDAFWMDETEITNREYKQFVFWVKDSIVRGKLADAGDDNYRISQDKQGNELTKPHLNWNKKIPWTKPTEEQQEAIKSMYYGEDESIALTPELNGQILNYKYSWIDYNQAALKRNKFNTNKGKFESDISMLGKGKDSADVMIKKDTAYIDEQGYIVNKTRFVELKNRRDFISSKIINVYPDTLCWIRDFTYAYNEPYMKMYFYHDGYGDYPVVGVNWEQASAFCHWRTYFYNHAQIQNKQHIVQDYRLPTESEWEYAARGGRDLSMYPWGGNYIRTAKGCFLGNFKPMHGNYTVDGHMVAAKVASFPPNDYGLYDMAGNVAEWTSSAYHESNYSFVNDLNPSYQYNAKASDPEIMKRKVIRGGSWKDIGYYLQCGTRTYEYQTENRCYIGFRGVRSVIGANQ